MNTLEDDFVETFSNKENRKGTYWKLFMKGWPIEGIDRDSPRIKELIELSIRPDIIQEQERGV